MSKADKAADWGLTAIFFFVFTLIGSVLTWLGASFAYWEWADMGASWVSARVVLLWALIGTGIFLVGEWWDRRQSKEKWERI